MLIGQRHAFGGVHQQHDPRELTDPFAVVKHGAGQHHGEQEHGKGPQTGQQPRETPSPWLHLPPVKQPGEQGQPEGDDKPRPERPLACKMKIYVHEQS